MSEEGVEMPVDLVGRARAGDRDAFDALVEPHRAELQAHCYRMLGSLQDAEDAVQESLLRAWLALAGFEGRSSVRTWLYRIATNQCLNQLRSARRRRAPDQPAPAARPTGEDAVRWLQPYPDELLAELPDQAPGPESRYESRESISLAFVRALQLLPPAQRAALLLRDVLGYPAAEAAYLLDVSVDSLNGALKRARAAVAGSAPPRPGDPDPELLERFVVAFTADSVGDLVALMSDDIWVRMPPLPFEYHGAAAAREFFAAVAPHRRTIERMVPVGANRQPGWGEYVRDRVAGGLHLVGVVVIHARGARIDEITHFDSTTAERLGLPRTLD
ncbi:MULTISPECIES: RNA polymerase subunit sigma-70 [Nocardioides]|nr:MULTISPECIES: RNA polymerase subunit sigma-70 [unclassified Nocardioides]